MNWEMHTIESYKNMGDWLMLRMEYAKTVSAKRLTQKMAEAEKRIEGSRGEDKEALAEYFQLKGEYDKELELYIRWRTGQPMPWEETE